MNALKPRVTIIIPDPFDGSAHTRLMHMGITGDDGQVHMQIMTALAHIFAGLFYDDIRDFHGTEDLLTIYETFKALYIKEDYHHMYLLMSIQYDYMGKPLPDPVWWLAGDSEAVMAFMVIFMQALERLMISDGILKPGEGVVHE